MFGCADRSAWSFFREPLDGCTYTRHTRDMKITEVEALVRAELGDHCTPVNLSGYWLIHYRNGDDRRLLAQSRSLPRAIADAKAAL